MGQVQRTNAVDLHGLARVQRERRWLAIMDGVLALTVVLWVGAVTLTEVVPSRLGWVLSLVIGVVGVHRLLVTLERQRRQRSGRDRSLDARRVVGASEEPLSRAGG
jgi:hypothetical protein